MSLQKTLIPFIFGLGLDDKENPQLTQGLTTLENGALLKGGLVQKRNGYAQLGGTPPVSAGLEVCQNELLLLPSNGNNPTSYAPSSASFVIKIPTGYSQNAVNPMSIVATKTTIIKNSSEQTAGDAGTLSGLTVYAWEDTRGGVWSMAVDQVTGGTVIRDTQINGHAAAKMPKVVPAGSYINVFHHDTSTNSIYCGTVSPAGPSFSAMTQQIISDASGTTALYDVIAIGASNFAVVYVNTSGFLKIAVFVSGSSPTVGNGSNGAPSPVTTTIAPTNSVAILYDSANTKLYLLGHDGTNGLRYTVYSYTASALTLSGAVSQAADAVDSPTVTAITGCASGSNTMLVYYTLYNATAINTLIKAVTLSPTGGPVAPTVLIRSCAIASKAFDSGLSASGHSPWFVAVFASSIQPTYFLIDAVGPSVIGRNLSGTAGGLPTRNILPEVGSPKTGVTQVALLERGHLQSSGGTLFALRGLVSLAYDRISQPWVTGLLGPSAFVASASTWSYDGIAWQAHGFHLYPEGLSATQANAGGSVGAGTYLYKATYEWTDARGQVHRSATSVAYSFTASMNTVTVVIPTLRVTTKQCLVALYRTQNGGTVYYKVGTASNTLSSDTVSVVDQLSDTTLGGNELLYTTGNVLDNNPPQSSSICKVFDTRLWLAGCENSSELFYSKTFLSGSGVAFSDLLSVTVPYDGGAITGLGVMDDKLVIFKQTAIFYLSGTGPTDTGDANGYSTPYRIPTDVGCISQKSIVTTPQGILFQSLKGIYVLDRALQVSYAGAQADQYAGLTITRSTLIDSLHEVRFLTSNGVCIVFNYFTGQWSAFQNHSGLDAVMWNNTYAYITAGTKKVWQETAGTFVDTGTTAIPFKIVTGWFTPQMMGQKQLQGLMRVYRATVLGTYKGAHQLKVSVGFDFKTTWDQVVTFSPQNTDPQYQYQVQISQQKCEAIRFMLEDVFQTASEGFSLTGLTLEVGLKPGTSMRLPATQKG